MANPECTCKETDDSYAVYGKDDTDRTDIYESIVSVTITDTIDFGKVEVGKKVVKSFKCKNTSNTAKEYYVHYDANTNPIYRTFDCSWTRNVDVGGTFECKIVYKPLFPLTVSVDYLFVHANIDGEDKDMLTVYLRGESIGPSVELSVDYLYFYAYSKKQTVDQIVELNNTGEMEALYQFDVVNSKSGLYTLSKYRGTIPPHKSHFITITFQAPKQVGMYSEKLCLLVLHHKPRMIHLLGCNTMEKIDETEVLLKPYNFDMSEKSDYSGYLYDVMTTLTRTPPVSLSETYLDFQGVCMETGADRTRKTLVTSLTNHMSEEIEVEWYQNDGAFTVTPPAAKIHAYGSRLFECTFNPQDADRLYHDVLSAGIYWIDIRRSCVSNYEYVTVPIPIQLRLLGHTFPPNRRWIPHIMIPDNVILPPCIGNLPSHTTFLLKVKGYLPVSYRLLPPKKTQFVMKPMMNVVDDYQIVVVYFRSAVDENKKAVVERWGIELNGLVSDFRCIYVKSYCEKPSLKIGVNETIVFPEVHPQCQEFQTVQLYNPSVHAIKYKFLLTDQHSLLEIDYPDGKLASNEAINLQWAITGKLQSKTHYTVICEIRSIERAAVEGKPFEIPVQVYTECSYSELCSMPTKCNFQRIEVGAESTFRFNLFNFGSATVHYKLIFWDRKKIDFDSDCMTIIPSQGSLKPKERNEILLLLHCNLSGNFRVHVYYQTRVNKNSPQIIDSNQIHEVFSFRFCSAYPIIQVIPKYLHTYTHLKEVIERFTYNRYVNRSTNFFQVTEINDHNFGPLFSKALLWDMFSLTKINNYLKSMKRGELKNVSIFMPESEMSQDRFECTLVLKNTSIFDTRVSLKRQKLCDCHMVQTNESVTFRRRIYDCKHRNVFAMMLTGDIFQTNSYRALTFLTRYIETGTTHLCYALNMSHNRILKLNIFVSTLAGDVSVPSKYLRTFHMDMKSVSVDDDQPPIRAYWLYNNTSNIVSYQLDTFPDDKRLFVRDVQILQCLNPEGSLLPFSTTPILFKFRPIQYKQYKFVLPILLGEYSYDFQIVGEGALHPHASNYNLQLPCRASTNPLDEVAISEEQIAIRPTVVWTRSETVLFIRNLSRFSLIGYSFDNVSVAGIVNVKVLHGKGVLKPKETHMLQVQITAFDQACVMTVQLPCKLLDHTAYYNHKETAMLYARRQEEIKQNFIITEHGTHYPPNDVVVTPMPLNFYKTISLDIEIITVKNLVESISEEAYFFQYPQYLLNLNYSKIASILKPEEDYQPIRSLPTIKRQSGANDDFGHLTNDPRTINNREGKTEYKCENVDIVRDAMDCMISHVIESEIFVHIMHEQDNIPPPYYVQFKGDSNHGELGKKEKSLRRSLRTMQAPFISDICNRIFTESVHDIFQLGSQVKSKVDLSYVYNVTNFKCKKKCTDKKCLKQLLNN